MKTWKILFIIIIVSLVGFMAFPMEKSVDELRLENKSLLQEKQEKIDELKEFTSTESANGDTVILDPELAIPQNLEQAELLIDLQKIASKTNIKLPNSWSFSVTDYEDLKISKIGVSFSIKGSRGNIYKFLQLAEKNERFLKVSGMDIKTFYEEGLPSSEMVVNLQAFAQENNE